LTEAILSRAKANAAVSKITENQALVIDLEIKRLQVLKELDVAQTNYNNRLKIFNETQDPSVGTALALATRQLQISKSDLSKIDKELISLNKINNTLTSFALVKQKEAILLDYREEKGIKAKTEAKKKDNKENKAIETFLLGSIGWYEQQIKLLKEQADVIKANSTVVLSENEAYNKQLSIIADYQLGLEKLLGYNLLNVVSFEVINLFTTSIHSITLSKYCSLKFGLTFFTAVIISNCFLCASTILSSFSKIKANDFKHSCNINILPCNNILACCSDKLDFAY